jgi:nitrate reductase assembly molybdenum cofactor insertion protein NarJ
MAAHRAARWRLIGLLFERPRENWHQEVEALAREISDPDLATATHEARNATEGGYLAVLGPGGVVSPRQAGHMKEGDPAQLISELNTFYRAFAFEPGNENPPDHIAVESGFVGFMKLKEAYARASGNHDGEGRTARAIAKFMDRHLRDFSLALADRLVESAPGYIADVARCAARKAMIECENRN